MRKTTMDQHVRRIMDMEARINTCKRCKSTYRCFRAPALGKGDLVPEIVLVFPSQCNQDAEVNHYMEIRQMLKTILSADRVYHTFMVRCQPRVCFHIDDLTDILDNKVAYHENRCHFQEDTCPGIPVLPAGIQIIYCMPYLMEEIDILSPSTVILFGKRTIEYGLKAVGIIEEPLIPWCYVNNGRIILTTAEVNCFTMEDAKLLAGMMEAQHAGLA